MKQKIANIFKGSKSDWNKVIYPIKKNNVPKFLLVIFIVVLTLFFIKITNSISLLFINHPVVNNFINLVLMVVWGFSIYKALRFYRNFFKARKSWIANNLAYMIHTLKLYDEEVYEIEKEGKTIKEKRIVRVVRIYYKETERKVYVRIMRDGDRFTKGSHYIK